MVGSSKNLIDASVDTPSITGSSHGSVTNFRTSSSPPFAPHGCDAALLAATSRRSAVIDVGSSTSMSAHTKSPVSSSMTTEFRGTVTPQLGSAWSPFKVVASATERTRRALNSRTPAATRASPTLSASGRVCPSERASERAKSGRSMATSRGRAPASSRSASVRCLEWSAAAVAWKRQASHHAGSGQTSARHDAQHGRLVAEALRHLVGR